MYMVKMKSLSKQVEDKDIAVSEAVHELGKFSSEFSAKFVKEQAQNVGAGIDDYLYMLKDRKLHPELYQGVRTPFPTLNRTWRGLRPGLHFLFGMEKSTKSIFAVNVAVTAADKGFRCLYVSNEGGEELLKNRIICCATGVLYDNLCSGNLTDEETTKIKNFSNNVLNNQSLFYVSLTPAECTVQEIEANVKRIEDTYGPVSLVIVDILSKTTTSTTKFVEAKYQEMEQVTVELKDLSDRHNLAVFVLSHLTEDGSIAGSKGITRHCDSFSSLKRDDDLKGQTSVVCHFKSMGVRDGADIDFDIEVFFPKMSVKESTFINVGKP
jgi:replicative DNA helicase